MPGTGAVDFSRAHLGDSDAGARSVTDMDDEPLEATHLLLAETGACAIVGYD